MLRTLSDVTPSSPSSPSAPRLAAKKREEREERDAAPDHAQDVRLSHSLAYQPDRAADPKHHGPQTHEPVCERGRDQGGRGSGGCQKGRRECLYGQGAFIHGRGGAGGEREETVGEGLGFG